MAKVKDPAILREKHKHAQRRRRTALGFVFSAFALIGVVTIAVLSVQFVHDRFFDDTEEKQNYQQLIAPLVAMDPAPFATIGDADQDMLLEAAVWAALEYEDTEKYERNEQNEIILPAVDVERYISQMYGSDYTISHHSFNDLDIEFLYDTAKQAYIIPITSQSGSYMPVVEKITQSGNTKILLVAYMENSTSAADVVIDSSAQTVVKHMEYVMLKQSKGYYLYAVREYTEPEAETPAAG